MEVILCAVFGTFIILSYTLGLINGQKLSKNKDIKIKTIPQIVKEHKQDKENYKEEERINTILSNIEKYDGSGLGQEEVK